VSKYRVQHYIDNIYEVLEVNKLIEGQSWDGWDDYYDDVSVFKGSLSDCEAYIRLKENENVDF